MLDGSDRDASAASLVQTNKGACTSPATGSPPDIAVKAAPILLATHSLGLDLDDAALQLQPDQRPRMLSQTGGSVQVLDFRKLAYGDIMSAGCFTSGSDSTDGAMGVAAQRSKKTVNLYGFALRGLVRRNWSLNLPQGL